MSDNESGVRRFEILDIGILDMTGKIHNAIEFYRNYSQLSISNTANIPISNISNLKHLLNHIRQLAFCNRNTHHLVITFCIYKELITYNFN